jgi:hypothetical protein
MSPSRLSSFAGRVLGSAPMPSARAIRSALAAAAGLVGLACAGRTQSPPPSKLSAISTSSTASPAAARGPAMSAPSGAASAQPAPETTAEASLSPGAPPTDNPPLSAPVITLEPPYKLGERAAVAGAEDASTQEERARWNRGDRGSPANASAEGAPGADLPPSQPESHPHPRVIIEIARVKGPHQARAIERAARQALWGKVIGCYRLGAYKDQTLKGKTTVRFQVSRAGKVSRVTAAGSTLPDKDVVACLAREVNSLTAPKAKAGSTATATIQIYPGDDPMPPPESAIKAGPGALSPGDIQRVITAAIPRFEACYKASLANFPELWGRLAIRLHVTASGKVDEAFEVESRFPDERAARCVLREARSLEFPPPEGGDLRFIAPLRFSPR